MEGKEGKKKKTTTEREVVLGSSFPYLEHVVNGRLAEAYSAVNLYQYINITCKNEGKKRKKERKRFEIPLPVR